MPRKPSTIKTHLAVTENRGGFIKARAACSHGSGFGRPRISHDLAKVDCGVCRMTMAYDMAQKEATNAKP